MSMKPLVIALTIYAAVLFAACTEPKIIIIQCNVCEPEDGPSGDQRPPVDFFMQATIDGKLWIANVDRTGLSTPLNAGGEIVVMDTERTSQITLRLPRDPVIGQVYQLTPLGQAGESSAFYTPNPSGLLPAYYESIAGSVTIKGINRDKGMIGGLFNFTGKDAQTGKLRIHGNPEHTVGNRDVSFRILAVQADEIERPCNDIIGQVDFHDT
ncbi:hypothetical protein SAMN04488109_1162 [Chryseolinea serpens]|uniref:Uncharacterized protein n=1 Tax=Chryseolinea serpens TaxID=947013 RepID=A0A1M5LE75_9BACT|nr:hypothetical protein SAMN04488109_1162 [Chryseolinea serpens]